ncbi:MAG: hypothetical protein ACRC2U_08005 [Aeromonas sp.]
MVGVEVGAAEGQRELGDYSKVAVELAPPMEDGGADDVGVAAERYTEGIGFV